MTDNYKVSRYNYFFDVDGREFVFNTFSGALSEINSDVKVALQSEDFSKTSSLKYINDLMKGGYLINPDVDELEILECFRSNLIYQDSKSIYEILPTTACNAKCFYCFEEGAKIKIMTKEVADKVCDYIIKSCPNKKYLSIHWFGGEPLLVPNIISYITKRLEEELEEKGVKITYQMTTNGSLFDEDMVKKAKDNWHISKVQITLDGTKDVYEKRKAYVNLENSFEKVVRNINLLADNNIQVGIRLNYDKENFDDLLNLIKYLSEHIHNKKYVFCYGYPLFGVCGSSSPDDRETALLLIKMNLEILKYGMSRPESIFAFRFVESKCYACSINSFLIDPEGYIGKCSMTVNDETTFIGKVDKPLRLTHEYLKWCSSKINEECENCKFLPLCQGGCKAGHLGYGPVKHYIYKNCFDEYLKEYVKYLETK